jgi:hypothetical protein
MKRRDILKALGVAPLAALPGVAQAKREVQRIEGDEIDLAVLRGIIERNELPWEAMTKAWDEQKTYAEDWRREMLTRNPGIAYRGPRRRQRKGRGYRPDSVD